MREIKFRAWDNSDKIMYKDIQLGIRFDDGSVYHFEDFFMPPQGDYHDWVLMQFTGLQDKNGVDIYEGDIVKIHYVGSPVVGSVEFYQKHDYEDGKWALRTAGWILADFKRKTGKEACEMGWHFSIEELREVIGNIYQNPELLTDNN